MEPQQLTGKQILANTLVSALVNLADMNDQCNELRAELARMKERVAELEARNG